MAGLDLLINYFNFTRLTITVWPTIFGYFADWNEWVGGVFNRLGD
jgi:hypothetical protein